MSADLRFPDEYSVNDRMRKDYEEIVKDTGLSLSCMDICDSRNGKEKADALHSYDFVILGGGHVPTESAFFARIGLADRFRGFEGIVMGISAGSMNCARIVYAQPELPGEAADPSYGRFIPGLGLTEYNILPHYNAVKNDVVDGLRLMEDITYPDSFGKTFYAIVDGTYLLQTEGSAVIHGEAYRIHDGFSSRSVSGGKLSTDRWGTYPKPESPVPSGRNVTLVQTGLFYIDIPGSLCYTALNR